MALTDIEKKLIQKMVADGKTKEEIPGLLAKAKEKLGLSGGSFMERASSMAQVAPTPTEATVQKAELVKENMPQINQQIEEQSMREEYKPSLASAFVPGGEVTIGAGEGLLKAGAGALSLLEKGTDKLGLTEDTGQTLGEKIQQSDVLKADKPGEGVGQFIGQNILPAVAGGIAGTGAKVLGGGSKVAQGLLGFLGSSTGGTTAYKVASEGELPTGKELATGAVIDAVTLGTLKYLPKVLSGVKGTVGKLYTTFMNKGASPMAVDTIETLAKNTSPEEAKGILSGLVKQEEAYLKDPIKNPSTLSTTGKEIFNDFTENLLPQKQAIGKELASQISEADNLAQAWGGMTDSDVLNSLRTGLEDVGVKVTDTGLDFADSTIRFSDANQNMLTKVFDEVKGAVDEKAFLAPSEKWSLAQALGDLAEYNSKLASQVTGKGEIPIIKLKGDLMNDVKNSLEQSGQAVDLFDQYKTYSDAIDSLNTRLGEGGEGGFSILKALQGEQKFGKEVRDALEVMKDLTGKDYFEMVRQALTAAEIAGNTQVKSLLATTSKSGLLSEMVQQGFMDKKLLIENLAKEAPGVARDTIEKMASAMAKVLGLDLVAGE